MEIMRASWSRPLLELLPQAAPFTHASLIGIDEDERG
jgi:hypothetical protein